MYCWVYILRCGEDTLYPGITTEVERRVDVHNRGTGAKDPRSRRPVETAYREKSPSRGDAQHREKGIKRLTRAEKQRLVIGYCPGNEKPVNKPPSAQSAKY